MSVSDLSASNQNYLKSIWLLGELNDEPVTASSLARRCGVRLSTVSDAVRKLTERGYLVHAPYGEVALTELGKEYALAMVRRHRLIESFLVEVLGYRWDQVHDEAEVLEHAVSDFMIERIDQCLGVPERDPHGDPIPRADGSLPESTATRLSQCEPGKWVIVERITDEDPELLKFFAQVGVGVGSVLKLEQGSPYSGSVQVSIKGKSDSDIALGAHATDAVWVVPA